MRLSAPKFIVFLISLVVVVAAALSFFGVVSIPVVGGNEIYFALGGYVLLMLGNILKGF